MLPGLGEARNLEKELRNGKLTFFALSVTGVLV